MTQTPLIWLVDTPEGESFTKLLTTACRGYDKIASLLNVFLYEGAVTLNRAGIDKNTVDSVQMKLENDDLLKGLERLNRHASIKTIIKWKAKLEEWGFLAVDGYRHITTLFFRKVEEAFKNPPPKEQPKLRGRHAHRVKDDTFNQDCTFNTTTMQEDCSFKEMDCTFDYTNNEVKTTILPEQAQNEIVLLRVEIVKLQSQIVNLQTEIVKLQSYNSREAASRASLEAKIDALYNLIDINPNIILNERREESNETPTSSSQSPPFTQSSSLNSSLIANLPDTTQHEMSESHETDNHVQDILDHPGKYPQALSAQNTTVSPAQAAREMDHAQTLDLDDSSQMGTHSLLASPAYLDRRDDTLNLAIPDDLCLSPQERTDREKGLRLVARIEQLCQTDPAFLQELEQALEDIKAGRGVDIVVSDETTDGQTEDISIGHPGDINQQELAPSGTLSPLVEPTGDNAVSLLTQTNQTVMPNNTPPSLQSGEKGVSPAGLEEMPASCVNPPMDEVNGFTQEMILDAALKAGCQRGRQKSATEACEKLAGIITHVDDIQSLYKAARDFYEAGKTIWVKNLVEDRVLAILKASQAEMQFWKNQERTGDLRKLMQDMKAEFPDLEITEWWPDDRLLLVIWFGPYDPEYENYLLVDSRKFWQDVRKNQGFIDFAVEWGKSLQQSDNIVPDTCHEEKIELAAAM